MIDLQVKIIDHKPEEGAGLQCELRPVMFGAVRSVSFTWQYDGAVVERRRRCQGAAVRWLTTGASR